jgi:peptidyl-prolyl cis-trans isomerase C
MKYLILTALLTGLTSCDFFSRRILAKPVAQVENIKLTAKDFSNELANKLKGFDALSAKDPKVLAFHRDQIINDFIVSAVIDLWFEENKISVGEEEVEAEIKKITSSYPNDSSFRETLSEAGLTFLEWKKKMETGVKRKKLLLRLREEAPPVAESEYLSFYNENKSLYEQKDGVLLSHIQVADENQATIVLKLLKRKKFSEVAKEYSSAYTNEAGDVYGWVEKGFLVGLDKAFRMRIGDHFGPVKIAEALHIFRVVDRKNYKVKPFAQARTQVVADVEALREKARFASWLDAQLKRYAVKKNQAVIDSIKVETQ